MSALVAVTLGRLLPEVARESGDKSESREAVLTIARELARLRRGDHAADALRRDRADWEREEARRRSHEEAMALAARQAPGLFAPPWAAPAAALPRELADCLAAAERLKGAGSGN